MKWYTLSRRLRLPPMPKWLLVVLFWAAVAAAVVGPWWSLPFPYTHDGENHLARFMNTAAALRQGQFPPRFAPDIMAGYGFPVLHYNYPLANLLAVPFVWLRLHPATIFALQAWTALVLGSVSVWSLARLRFSRRASLLATLIFSTSSPLISMVLWRGNIGEIWAYSLTPVVLLTAWKLCQRASLLWWWLFVLASTAFGLSHNVLVVMFAPWIGSAVIWMAWQSRALRRVMLAGATSLGLTLWFWIPALSELSLIVLQDDSLATQARLHVLEWGQIWWSELGFGFSFAGPLDSLGYGLGVPAFLVTCLGIALGLQALLRQEKASALAVWGGSALVLSLFLASHTSTFVWESVWFLSLFQFPWRWLALTSLALAPLAAWVVDRLPAKSWIPFGLVFLTLVQARVSLAQPLADRVNHDAQYYRFFPHSTTTRNENRPRTLTLATLPDWSPSPRVISGAAEFEIQQWNGSQREYTVTVSEDAVIAEPTIFFPGWQLQVDGQVSAFDPALAEGLSAYTLASRELPYQVRSQFSARTPARLVGEGGTLAVAVSSLIGSAWWLVRQQKKKTRTV